MAHGQTHLTIRSQASSETRSLGGELAWCRVLFVLCRKLANTTRHVEGRTETYIFESVQVLVPLVAVLALMGLFLLHAQGARVWSRSLRVDNREGAVAILMQLLSGVAVRLVVPKRGRKRLVGNDPTGADVEGGVEAVNPHT